MIYIYSIEDNDLNLMFMTKRYIYIHTKHIERCIRFCIDIVISQKPKKIKLKIVNNNVETEKPSVNQLTKLIFPPLSYEIKN